MNYEWKEGLVFGRSVDPEKAAMVFAKLRERDGAVTSQAVLQAARPKRSPLHSAFIWDDTAAAEKYRLDQASRLIRGLVVFNIKEGQKGPIRAFANVSHHVYSPIQEVMSNEQQRTLLLQRAWQDLQEFRKRYEDLSEFAELFGLLDRMAG